MLTHWAAVLKPRVKQTLPRDCPKQMAALPGTPVLPGASQQMLLAAPSSRRFRVTGTKHSPTELRFQVRVNWAETGSWPGPLGSLAPSGVRVRAPARPLPRSDQVQDSALPVRCRAYMGKAAAGPSTRRQEPPGGPTPRVCRAPSPRQAGRASPSRLAPSQLLGENKQPT